MQQEIKQPLIVIAGPTAVGKTELSLLLARRIGGEIISADSMQVYRHMDIGTAKLEAEKRREIAHHLIDILEPEEEFNVVLFQKLARQAVKEIAGRGHIPVVAGGTGFYIQALLYDIDFTETKEDPALRERLARMAGEQGPQALHDRLREVDPQAAEEIHAHNVKRVIRALEFFSQTGKRISDHNRAERGRPSPYRFFYYVLNTDRAALYERIDRRVDAMMEAGLLEEVRALRARGLTRDMVSMQGLGYKEMLSYLDGERSLEEAVSVLKRDTRHFAKRQLTWFKRERDVRFLNLLDYGSDPQRLLEVILQDLAAARIREAGV